MPSLHEIWALAVKWYPEILLIIGMLGVVGGIWGMISTAERFWDRRQP